MRNGKKVILVGNENSIFNICNKLLSINNKLNLTILVDGEKIYEIDKNVKQLSIPKIYCKVKSINPIKKEIFLSNGGVVDYDFLIITPSVSLPFNVDENILGIYPIYGGVSPENIESIAESSFYLLVVGSINKELKEKFEKYSKNLYIKDASDIQEIKSFDGKVTSVLLKNETLLFADAIIVTSYLREKPSFLLDLGISQEKLELLDLYYIDFESINNSQSLFSNLELKLKPEELYMCPYELKVITECECLENGYELCKYYNTTVCRIQNNMELKDGNIISRFIEKSITSNISENVCNLCGMGECKNSLMLCGEDNEELYLREFILNSINTLMFRENILGEKPKLHHSIYETANPFKLFDNNKLKSFANLLLNENERILKRFSLKNNRLYATEIDFNFGAFIKDKINILYIGNKKSLEDNFFEYLKENSNYNLICMGCGGLDISIKYGFPYLGSVLDEEFTVLSDLLDGVIVDEGCVLSGFAKKVSDSNIPILLNIRNTKEALSFLSAITIRERNSLDLILSKNRAFIGLPHNNFDDLDANGFVIFPGCSGSLLGGDFLRIFKDFLSKGYALFLSGCNLANLANLGYFGISPKFFSPYKIFGIGGFDRIYDIAFQLKNKNIHACTALEGIIKYDAILDSLTLKKFFGFEIVSNDRRVNNYINALN